MFAVFSPCHRELSNVNPSAIFLVSFFFSFLSARRNGHTIIGRSLTIRFPSSSSTSIPQRTFPDSTSHMRSTPSHPPPARRPYLPTRKRVAAGSPGSVVVASVVERESMREPKENGENAKEPVPDSRPGRTWSVSPDRASNSLMVESCPPLFVSR